MNDGGALEDVRAQDPVERLLEDSWGSRSRRASRAELIGEGAAAALFLAVALPLAIAAFAAGGVRPDLALLLVGLYAVSLTAEFPIGAGYVVPSYLVLVPMLLLLPPEVVPLLVAIGLLLGTVARWIAHRAAPRQILFAVPDAWHAVGPAVVLSIAGSVHGAEAAVVYTIAFLAGCLVDLITSTWRESLALGVAPRVQLRVIVLVWLVDACLAPIGLLAAYAARDNAALLLLLVPLMGLLVLADRDRSARIAEAQRRLDVVAHQRTRLQSAVYRLGDSFAARLDLLALTDVVLNGSVDALDAAAGCLVMRAPPAPPIDKVCGERALEPVLDLASSAVRSRGTPSQVQADGAWALAIPWRAGSEDHGLVAVARRGPAFSEDEQALMTGLVERAQMAAAEIVAHDVLREQAQTDPLTQLGNRRKLARELGERLVKASREAPLVLMLFDLDGFKSYNDTFGHVAGDALLARLGHKLDSAVAPHGSAYRLGGDEFCVTLPVCDELHQAVEAAAGALEERGEKFVISASCGTVLLPHEAATTDYALQLADRRMYAHKHGRPAGARDQAHDVLIHILRAKQQGLPDHSNGVARLAVPVGRRLGMDAEQLDELWRAASLHDIGKVGIPDAILAKPGPLDAEEWAFIRQHTVLGERILSAAPALRPVATIVRACHERWDGDGYPDRLRGNEIPLAARIVAVCDAYDTIISNRSYRAARTPQQACEELRREAGRQFDPAVVATFLEELERLDPAQSEADVPGTTARPDGRAKLAADVVTHVRELLGSSADRAATSLVLQRREHI